MDDIDKSDIVYSLNGRGEGKAFVVLYTEDQFAYVANGKDRRLDKPKKKKLKHLRFAGKAQGRIAEKLRGGEKVTNSDIRRLLHDLERQEGV